MIQASFPCLFVLKLALLQHTLTHLAATNTLNQTRTTGGRPACPVPPCYETPHPPGPMPVKAGLATPAPLLHTHTHTSRKPCVWRPPVARRMINGSFLSCSESRLSDRLPTSRPGDGSESPAARAAAAAGWVGRH